MRPIEKRIAELEEESRDTRPYFVWQDGHTRPEIPKDIGNRTVTIVRWLRPDEPHQDVAQAAPKSEANQL